MTDCLLGVSGELIGSLIFSSSIRPRVWSSGNVWGWITSRTDLAEQNIGAHYRTLGRDGIRRLDQRLRRADFCYEPP